ncbi:hypothetical protein GNF10_15050 [Nostoc sp. UCD121]|uniref:hypothetical protein n=1 Tax=unclassified Nostoc TaxID=2593658 RepID=UPI0016246E77|nr:MULTISPECIES: hypothetical protein [unclassified Nostoc]MBC1222829.1 hypothetical protein [Nostoc sp. UCD120]MBC1277238.1 hypothetical protein [Nostoc sp. UCD121]MBC1293841.1 hypothetical protein [Nostoc sp. UCD122]
MSERYIELISDFADITAETLIVTVEYQVIQSKIYLYLTAFLLQQLEAANFALVQS